MVKSSVRTVDKRQVRLQSSIVQKHVRVSETEGTNGILEEEIKPYGTIKANTTTIQSQASFASNTDKYVTSTRSPHRRVHSEAQQETFESSTAP